VAGGAHPLHHFLARAIRKRNGLLAAAAPLAPFLALNRHGHDKAEYCGCQSENSGHIPLHVEGPTWDVWP
jgi:hypothetical protein